MITDINTPNCIIFWRQLHFQKLNLLPQSDAALVNLTKMSSECEGLVCLSILTLLHLRSTCLPRGVAHGRPGLLA